MSYPSSFSKFKINGQIIILLLTLMAAVSGSVWLAQMKWQINRQTAQAREAAKPVQLQLIKLTVPQCEDCFNLELAVDLLKKQPVNITAERAVTNDSEEGKVLISSFKINRLPTIILRGDLTNEKIQSFLTTYGEIRSEAFVFTAVPPIFFDVASGQAKGQVELITLKDWSCADCYDPKIHENILANFGLKFSLKRGLDISSAEAKRLINKYKITAVPTIIISPEAAFYQQLQTVWPSVGSTETDGSLVFRKMQSMGGAIYRDLSTNKIIRPAATTATPTN